MGKRKLKEFAATNFEPLEVDDLERLRAFYDRQWDGHKATLGLSLDALGKTKDELKEAARWSIAENFDILEGFKSAEQFLKNCVEIVEKAKLRIVVAGAEVELAERGEEAHA